MKFKKNYRRNERAFSLIEILVSLLIFTVLITGVSRLFGDVISMQRRGYGAQKVQENIMHVFELMAREVRVSQIVIQDSSDCSATSLTLIHPVNGTVAYGYDSVNKNIFREALVGGVVASASLVSKDVLVNRLNFCIRGSELDDEQARVAVITQVQNNTTIPLHTMIFDLQTTMTSRDMVSEP